MMNFLKEKSNNSMLISVSIAVVLLIAFAMLDFTTNIHVPGVNRFITAFLFWNFIKFRELIGKELSSKARVLYIAVIALNILMGVTDVINSF